MKTRNRLLAVLAVIVLAAMPANRVNAVEEQVTVEAITDLGTLGGTFSIANDINDAGQVIGVSTTADGVHHAFLWQVSTGMIDLGTLPHQTQSQAHGINSTGQVVGESWQELSPRGFLWQASTGMTDLGWMGSGGNEVSAINDAGQIVGRHLMCERRTCPNQSFLRQPSGEFIDLGTLGSGYNSDAHDINSSGQVVGWSELEFLQGLRAFLWQESTGMIDLGVLPGGAESEAFGINNAGQVVGWSEVGRAGGIHQAFVWQADTGMTGLGSISGDEEFSEARGINDAGKVVGVRHIGWGWQRAFYWQPTTGMIDIGALDGGMSEARSINNRMQVVGQSTKANGETHAVLWTLSSEPAENHLPVAICGSPNSIGFVSGSEGHEVWFDAGGSWDMDGDPLTYTWDFGDGNLGDGLTTTHAYADNGSFQVQLMVIDDGGLSATASCRAEIFNVSPVIRIMLRGWPPTATINLGETFTASGIFWDPGADTWTATVDYGDPSGVQSLALLDKSFTLSHVYSTAGTYVVTVTVTDDDSGSGFGQPTVVVLTHQQAIQAMSSTIANLVASGALAPAMATSLNMKLGAAVQQLDLGSRVSAANQLNAFINEVKALISAGSLSPGEGQNLIEAAQRIIRLIDQW